MRKLVSSVFFFLCVIAPCWAQTTESLSTGAASEPFDVKGRVYEITAIVSHVLESLREKMSPQMTYTVDQTLDDGAFNPEILYPSTRAALIKEKDPRHILDQAENWYGSSVGEKLAQESEDASSPQEQNQLEDALSSASSDSSSPSRSSLLAQINRSQEISINAAYLLNSIMKASFRTSDPSAVFEYHGRYGYREKNTIPQTLGAKTESAAGATLAYAYRRLSDEELKAVLVFFQSDAGKSYTRAFHNAFAKALLKAESNFKPPSRSF